ncbi:MAG: eukaryotic-like serine/threonine-protein kinase [Acidobacteriota bacterium]|jgi:serine/threonine-protein kinase|nr:eukaryotic-like serine/threonine-protein kinase [Acidobacteriota bacterium]
MQDPEHATPPNLDGETPSPISAGEQAPPREVWSIGPYRVERRLGQGGMGEVFLAHDDRLGRRVAIKRIREGSAPAIRSERFRREARAAARLSHPAIVQIYDLVEDSAGVAIVMEYVEGRTLADLTAAGLPDPPLAVRLARDVAGGLAAAHAAGLVHRDLKAENVVVTAEGRAKILDFGLAKPLTGPEGDETLTVHGAVIGTCHSMSPEQASGGDVDARSDLFSFGVLLYEMLTGRSPFRGSNSLDTLRRVITHHPPPISALRPGLPHSLSELIERLLAKDREARPRSAAEVAANLEEIAASPELEAWRGTPPDGGQERWSELATHTGLAPVSSGRKSSAVSSSHRSRHRPWLLAAAVVVLAALALGAVYLLSRQPPETLRIAVLKPATLPAGHDELDLAASGVLMAALSTLASFEGVAPLDPTQAGTATSPAEAARAAAADEVLAATVEGQGALGGRVTLRRLQGSDGRVLWTESFPVPTEPRDLRLLADAVAVHLRRGYPDRQLRRGTPELAVRDEDYSEFLRIKRRSDLGTPPVEPDLAQLEEIARRSPRFLEAHLQVANFAQSLFRSTREPRYLERGRKAARAALALAPGDPRPLVAGFRIAIAGHQPEEAARLLPRLAPLLAGDSDLQVFSGLLAESRGNLGRAIADLESAVQRDPSWANLFRLADLEIKAGRVADARQHLEELLARSPGNLWGLDRLGNLELLVGDPVRAEQLYLDMIRLQPQRSYYTNLGLARSLLGRNAEAVTAYRKALELAPGHGTATLNLADAELALGHEEEARSLYGQLLAHLETSEAGAGLSPLDRMIKAQCLAHLGRTREAVAVAQRTLRQSFEDPEIVYNASLVYALAGDRASALVNAQIALEKGVQPRWFTLAAFGPLRNDPDLQALLRKGPAPEGRPRN